VRSQRRKRIGRICQMESCQGHKTPNFKFVSSEKCKLNLSKSGKSCFFLGQGDASLASFFMYFLEFEIKVPKRLGKNARLD